MVFNYPLSLTFRLIALAPRIAVRDPNGEEVLYIEQKLLALKEKVSVFRNSQKTDLLYKISANQIIDIGAQYSFFSPASEQAAGSVKQEGLRTIWKATYNVLGAQGGQVYKITEKNPWVKLLDALFSLIPFVGWFSGYFIHPAYLVKESQSGRVVMSLRKLPSFLERSFQIDSFDTNLNPEAEILCLLSLVTIVQLEQGRG